MLSSSNNKKRRAGKPWWNDELSRLWNNVCMAEKDYVKSSRRRPGEASTRLKHVFVNMRKTFDKQVQLHKRMYRQRLQDNLVTQAKY